MVDDETRQCPFCKEQINSEATKCKYCASRVEPARPQHRGQCPFCKEAINPEALICKHCKSNLQVSKDCACSHERPFTFMMGHPNLGGFSDARPHTASLSTMQRQRQCETWCYGSTLMCACPVNIPGLGQGIIIYACGTCIDDPIFNAFA
ncbi:Double zinc ribbon [Nitrosovibrio sp. Nv4]|nr:Double zinc ribbon [Nitrosovibrio sp. Nv4]